MIYVVTTIARNEMSGASGGAVNTDTLTPSINVKFKERKDK